MASRPLRRDQSLLVAASVVAFVLWVFPLGRMLILPLVYLNTHLHELCHALAAVFTGGSAERILVFWDGSGVTPILGGWLPVIASAGYVGAMVIGAGMIYFGRSERGAKLILAGVGSLLVVSLLVWVRNDAGWITGLLWAAALLLMARFTKGETAVFAVQFIGVQQILAAGLSILTLLRISTGTEKQSDAQLMASATGLPAIVWASLYAGLAVLLTFLTLKAAWHEKPGERG